MKELKVDEEFSSLIPRLSEQEVADLEKSLVENGYQGPGIQVWNGTIVDGHNRYWICLKHNIEFKTEEIQFANRNEAMQWMIRTQIARRNLSKIERIRLAEKSRAIIEREAKERHAANGGDKKSAMARERKSAPPTLAEAIHSPKEQKETNTQLAKLANVGKETYRKGVKILNSHNSEILEKVRNNEMSINAAYKEITGRMKKEEPAAPGTGISKEILQQEMELNPKSMVARRSKDSDPEIYEALVEFKADKNSKLATPDKKLILVNLGVESIKSALQNNVAKNLFADCNYMGYEKPCTFTSVASSDDIDTAIQELSSISDIINSYIEKLEQVKGARKNEQS